MKKVVLGIILFVLIMMLPYFPYKRAFSEEYYDASKIHLQVRYHETNGELLITYGKKHLKKYIVDNKLKDININKIELIGREPYKEIADFEIGIPAFRDFVVVGKFVDHKSSTSNLNFQVCEWYPVNESVKLKDTIFWHMYNYSLWRVVTLTIIFIYIFFHMHNRFS